MDWLWTWSGVSFGYREGDDLWTHDGRHVGRFRGDEVFSREGCYVGEIMQDDRLITCPAKAHLRAGVFTPRARRGAMARRGSLVGLIMIVGHQDFPSPDQL